ncbi:MAG TPA: hydrogenase nickel incorporation protein HypB [Polyangiaceae bacterium]|nr:hydrogenase nickel incorporation protein HypB [Polyangiaceae bacterium]
MKVDIHESLLLRNQTAAEHNRSHFARRGVFCVNLMGSPGSGKTALLEATGRALAGRRTLAAMSGDLATDHDAQRLTAAGIPSCAITTGSACHLDADLVHTALHELNREFSMLFIENVGNLVCPAIYDLGQARNVVALSVTEGEDKPLKYPVMFRNADLVVITKIDLLPHLPRVDVGVIQSALERVMARPRFMKVSAETGEGMSAWFDWLSSAELNP